MQHPPPTSIAANITMPSSAVLRPGLLSPRCAISRPNDPSQAERGLERWLELAAESPASIAHSMRDLARESGSRAVLATIFGNSPFLTECLLKEAEIFIDFNQFGAEPVAGRLSAELAALAADADMDRQAVDAGLRRSRRRVALLTALADICGAWKLERVTEAISSLAEFAVAAALKAHWREAAGHGQLGALPDPATLAGCGYFFLGMGKLGGRELNYSSDIDLIALFDPELVPAPQADRLQHAMVRLTQGVVKSLQERTADGYVFRTDLRLRPDPGATPLAMSVFAAEAYYESMGQNWERAAMIKARPIAGDLAAGESFIAHLRPFIWRKNLDFAAIQDIHSIKRQINAHRGGGQIALYGHNVKLGRGGIREIEFFAQTQQLIFGGREPALRQNTTRGALLALAAAGHITRETADDLIDSYRFLRTVEHRLQMIDDQQVHSLPTDDAGIAAFAAFLGYDDGETFAGDLLGHLKRVEDHYAHLFEEAPTLSGPGNLVFTGGDHDPDTLRTLAEMGFREPETVSSLVRSWHHGRFRATRSQRAREILTEIMPALLAALGKTPNPDAAFTKFHEFLAALPAGVQLFSLFHANPQLLEMVAEIMGGAPSLAEHLARRPTLFDALLAPAFFGPPQDETHLRADLEAAFEQAGDFQDVLDIARRWANDRKFQIGVQFLRGTIDAEAAGRALSDIADAVIRGLQPRVETDFARQHGSVPSGAMVVVAYGKLGGRELSATSDLDLVFVYDAPAETTESTGSRPLPTSQYYIRLCQRIVNAITAPTGEGKLYDVDMRLRPSGNKGPIAARLSGYAEYQRTDAWTWEHMALTRARLVSGDASVGARVMTTIRDALLQPRDKTKLLLDVADMRRRIDQQHHTESLWQVKHVRGGLVDAEFIAQYLQLRDAARHPEVLSTNTAEAFERLGAAASLPVKSATVLAESARLWQQVQ
ncbi:MAG: bifunctional [glutamine synthetase] adenylyltransferase/[glutamine synthetase]-adenylyl-L-tyrosine phosphorylase, partial [Alphaproteobacteria bacterium]